MENLTVCPICGSGDFENYLTVRDYFFSEEEFSIVKCSGCGFKFTNPRPAKNEIEKYYNTNEYLSHDTEKNDPITLIYRTIRDINIRSKFNLVKRYSTGYNLLDIGCGTGEFIQYCEKNGYIVNGIEPNEKARKHALDNNGIPVFDESHLDDEQDAGKDVVTLWHVIEHVHDLNERMKQIHRLLKKEGTLIIAVPNNNSPDCRKYGRLWAAWDVPRHLYHFETSTMKHLAENYGFEIRKIIPMRWDAYYVSMLSEKYRKGKNDLWNAFWAGSWSNYKARKENLNYSSLVYIIKRKKSKNQ
ncbi:MAG: class I SAM-dependent methyltransferase [Bacteroidota bacterium]|nr:class I SAM-dependent methyltransferase [Bacteroidota bacterium]